MLNPQQQQAANLVLGGKTYAEISKEIGVSIATISRWMSKGEVHDFVQALRKATIRRERAKMSDDLPKMLHALKDIGLDLTIAPGVRVKAICEYLDRAGFGPITVDREDDVTATLRIPPDSVKAALEMLAPPRELPAQTEEIEIAEIVVEEVNEPADK